MALFGQIASAYVEVESKPDRQFKSRITRAAEDAGGEAGRRGGGRFAGMFSGLAGKAVLGLAGAAAAGVGALGFMGVKTAANLQQAQISFETLLGSGKEARSFLGELKDFAAKTPFELPGLQDSARQMLGVGRSVDDVLPALTAYGDAAGALGLNQESMNRVMLASNQAFAKGKLQGEEMMQMMEAGIPVTSLLSKALGVTQEEVLEMGSKGELLAKDVLPLLEEQMAKDYGGAMAKQSQTLSGLWSTLMDTLNLGAAEVIQPLIPLMQDYLPGAIESTASALSSVAGFVADSIETFQGLGDAFRVLGGEGGASAFGAAMDRLVDGGGRWAGLFETIGNVLLGLGEAFGRVGAFVRDLVQRFQQAGQSVGPSGPLGQGLNAMRELWAQVWPQIRDIVVGVLGALRAILSSTVGFFQGIWARSGEQMMATASRIWRAIVTVIRGALQVIQGVIQVVTGVFRGDWSKAWEGIRNITAGLTRIITGIIRAALDVIRGVFRGALAVIQTLWSGAWTRVRNTVESIVSGIVRWIRGRLDAIATNLRVWGFVFQLMWSNALGRVRSAVTDWGSRLVAWFRDLPSKITTAMGNIGQRIKDKFSAILKGFSIPIKLAFGLGGDGLGLLGTGAPGGGLMGAGGAVAAAYSALGRPGDVISGFRPGSRTRSGNLSYHARRRALDITPIRAIAVAINRLFGSRTLELITPWRDLNLHHGRPHSYSAGIMADHSGSNAHIHWAMNRGGRLGLPRGENRDSLLGAFTPGEFVVNREETERWLPLLEAINSGQLAGLTQPFNRGGLVKAARRVLKRLRSGRSIFEDLTWKGMPRSVGRFNDELADMVYARTNDFERGAITEALRDVVQDLKRKPAKTKSRSKAKARGGASGGFDAAAVRAAGGPLVYIENMNVFDPRRAAAALRDELAYAELMHEVG